MDKVRKQKLKKKLKSGTKQARNAARYELSGLVLKRVWIYPKDEKDVMRYDKRELIKKTDEYRELSEKGNER